MADIQSSIRIDVDTSGALASIRGLQSQISQFQTSMNRGTAAQSAAAGKLSQQLLSGVNASGRFAASIQSIQTSSESFTSSLEKNKLSFGQYFRHTAASTKTFGRFFKSELSTIEKTARERVKTLQTQYVKLGRDASGAMKAVAVRPLTLDMDNLGTKTAIAAQKQQIMNQLLRQGSTNLLNFGKNTQWAGRQLMVGFTLPLAIFGGIAAKTFMKLEQQVIDFKKVYGDLFTTGAESDKALNDVRDLADEFTKYGIAVSDTIGIAAEAAAAGFSGQDLINQTSAAIKISVLGQLDQQKALETTISLQNAFKLSNEDLADSINFLNAVENQTVISLDDITTAIPKVAPVIQALGGDVKDLAFFLAAMKEGGVNASEGANALKSSLGRLINPTKVAKELFMGFGIDLVDIVDKNAGDVKSTIIDLADAMDTLDPLNRSRAIEQLFGKFQFARMSTLFENINKDGTQAARVLDLAAYSAADLASISEKELGVTAASAMNQFRGSVERLQAAIAPIGELFLQIVTPLVDFATNVIDKFNNLDVGVKKFVAGLVGVLGIIGPVALMTFGLLANGAANLIKGFVAVMNIFQKTGKQSQVLGEQTNYLTEKQLQEMAVAASLEQTHNRLAQAFTSEAAAIEKLTAAYGKAIQRQQQFGGAGMATNIGRGAVKKYKSGVVSVPGTGSGDKVPAMLEPGEAVIPKDMARRYAGLINGMVAGDIPGYKKGRGATPGGTLRSPGGNSLEVGNLNSLRAIEKLVAELRDAPQLIDQAFDELSSSVKVTKDEFVNKVRSLAKDSGKKLPESFSTERKYSASKFGEKRSVRTQLSDERGAEGVKEYEQQLSVAKKLRVELEEINRTKIEAGQNPVFSDAEIKDLTQVDRAHIIDVDKKKVGKAGWNSQLFQPEVGAQNRFAGSVSRSPNNQKAIKDTMLEMGTSQQEIDTLMDKYTRGLSLTEAEQDTQAKVLKKLLQKLESNAELSKQVSPAFAKQATAVTKVAEIKSANPGLKRAAERNVKKANDFYQKALVDATNKAGQMQSPSKRTSRSGENLVAGLEQGLASGQDDMAAAGQQLASAASQQIFNMPAGRRSTTNQNAYAAGVRQRMQGADATGLGLVSSGAKQGNAYDMKTRKLIKATGDSTRSMQGMTSGIMQASFAFSSISMLTSGLGGEMSGLQDAVFGISNAMFALSAILPLIIALYKKMAGQMAGQSLLDFAKGGPAAIKASIAGAKGLAGVTKVFSGGVKSSFGNLIAVGGSLGGVLGKIVPLFLKFIPFLGVALTAFAAFKIVGDIQEKQKQKIEGMGNAAFAAGKKLDSIVGLIGFAATRSVDRSSQINSVQGLETGGSARAAAIRTSDEFADLKDKSASDGGFKEDIQNIRNATRDQAERALNGLVIELLALSPEGTDPARIQEFVAAIASEAGKTGIDLSIGLKFDPRNEDTFDNIQAAAEQSFEKVVSDYESTLNRIADYNLDNYNSFNFDGMSGSTNMVGDLQALGSEYSSFFETLSTGFSSGTISADAYSGLVGELLSNVNSLGPSAGTVLEKMFANIGVDKKQLDGIDDINNKLILFEAIQAGVSLKPIDFEILAAGDDFNSSLEDRAALQTKIIELEVRLGKAIGITAEASAVDVETERQEAIALSTEAITDQLTANQDIVDLYPDLLEALGNEEAALAAVTDEKTRQLLIDAKAQDIAAGTTSSYDSVIALLKDLAASEEDVNDVRGQADMKTYLADLEEQNSVLSWLTSNGQSVSDALDIIGNSTFLAGAKAAMSAEDYDMFVETMSAILDLEKKIRAPSGGNQQSPFQKAIEGLKEERQQLQETNSAYNKLRQQGFSITQAFESAKDSALAAAIATTKVGTKSWERLVGLLKQVDTLARSNAIKGLLKEQAAARELNSAFVNVAQTLGKMGYEADQIEGILSNPALAQEFIKDLEDGQINARLLRDYLNGIEKDKKISLKIQLSTPEGIQSEFDNLYGQAMESFGIRRDRVDDDFQDRVKSAQDAVDSTNDAIEKTQKSIDSIQTTIDDKQRDIEMSISRPVEALQKEISDLQRSLELSTDRPMSALQDESSVLSNDLTIIDKLTESINNKYEDQAAALDKVLSINQQLADEQSSQLDIADALSQGDIAGAARAAKELKDKQSAQRAEDARNKLATAQEREIESLKTASGLTRVQVEERQYEISQAVFALEQQKKATEAEILSIQDQIYAYEQLREVKLAEIIGLEDQIYAIQSVQLFQQQKKLEEQEYVLEALDKEKQLRLDAIALEEEAYNDAKLAFDEAMQRGKDYVQMLIDAMALLQKLTGMKAPTTEGSGLDKAATSVFRADGVTVLDRDTAAASSIAAVKSGQAASPLDFANQVRDTVLANRASVRGGDISAAQKAALTKQNIQLMQSTGLKFAMGGMVPKYAMGGMVPKYFASGGYAMGTDTVPAMLTPGEFVVKKYAVESFGTENLKAINNGTYAGESVYNYSVNVSVKSDANPDQIARSVMTQIKQIDSQRIRSNKF